VFSTGGSERLRITSAGLVGIGTSSPGAKIHSLQASTGEGLRVDGAGSGFSLVVEGGTTYHTKIRQGSIGSGYFGNTPPTNGLIVEGSVGIGTSSPGQLLDVAGVARFGANATKLTTYSDSIYAGFFNGSSLVSNESIYMGGGNTYFYNNGSPSVTILSSGNVGIGTASPSNLLHLSAAGTSYLQIQNTSAGNNFYVGNSAGTGIFELTGSNQFKFISNSSDRVVIDSSGRLLVGTSTSAGSHLLQIQGNTNSPLSNGSIALRRGQTNPGIEVLGEVVFTDAAGSRGASIEATTDLQWNNNDYPTRLTFSTTADGASTPTERMRITNTGAILLGCSSAPNPGAGSTSNGWAVNGTGSDAYVTSKLDNGPTGYFRRDGTDGAIFLFYKENVTVGSISVTAAATAFNTSSDYRLKENVTPVSDGITRLQQLKPSRFNFIADPDKTVDGFLAHEVQTIVPEAITGEKDAVDDDGNPVYQGIDQSKLVPLLTAALQEAIAKIETLEGMVAVNNITIDEQQHQLSTLAARLTALESA
jgi:hypothetical protein